MTKKTGMGPNQPRPIAQPQTQQTTQKPQTQKTQKAQQAQMGRGIENLKAELPKSGLKGTSSPLSGLIKSGLDALAKAEGWEGQQRALGVLVSAMMQAQPKQKGQTNLHRVDFESMLKRLSDDEDEVKEDSEKLAALAALVVNPDEGRGKKRRGRGQEDDEEEPPDEMQLKRDVEEVRDALNDVLHEPTEAREAHIGVMIDNLGWLANQLGKVDWQNPSVTRIDGFVGMMKIVVKYVRKGRDQE